MGSCFVLFTLFGGTAPMLLKGQMLTTTTKHRQLISDEVIWHSKYGIWPSDWRIKYTLFLVSTVSSFPPSSFSSLWS